MTKKLLIAVLLLVVVGGLSYIKTVRGKQQNREAYESGKREGVSGSVEFQNRVDSLRQVIGEAEIDYADALVRKDVAHLWELDSLERLVHTQQEQIESLRADVGSRETGAGKSERAKQPLTLHERVLACYKKRHGELPKDLSAYERKIAIAEIREETARKFSITVQELNRIREAQNIGY